MKTEEPSYLKLTFVAHRLLENLLQKKEIWTFCKDFRNTL